MFDYLRWSRNSSSYVFVTCICIVIKFQLDQRVDATKFTFAFILQARFDSARVPNPNRCVFRCAERRGRFGRRTKTILVAMAMAEAAKKRKVSMESCQEREWHK